MYVDAYSKFPEVVKMTNTTVSKTIPASHDIFNRHGLPEILVLTMAPNLPLGTLNCFVLTMEFYTVYRRPINHLLMVRLNKWSRF